MYRSLSRSKAELASSRIASLLQRILCLDLSSLAPQLFLNSLTPTFFHNHSSKILLLR